MARPRLAALRRAPLRQATAACRGSRHRRARAARAAGQTGRVDFLSVNLLPAYRRAIRATEEGQAALGEVVIKPMRTPELSDDRSV
jgi:hypothetical protein